MKYVFGPVQSRRLGRSLGIDPVPLKTCNWNCVYCQLGRSRPVVNERAEYYPAEAIVAEVEEALQRPDGIDWVSFVGSGEPLLHARLGWMIRQVKGLTSLPVALITNGSLLYLPEVRREVVAADAVLPTLDAGTPELYRRINRPHPEVTYERLIEGLAALRHEYRGKLWPEVMLIGGLNDGEGELRQIAERLKRIEPDEIHINLPTRPPAEAWLQPPDEDGVMRAVAIFEAVAPVRVAYPVEGVLDLSGFERVVEAVIAVLERHPLSEADVEATLERWSPGQVKRALEELESSGRARAVTRYGKRFWTAAPSHFPGHDRD